jgi:hypothetical protein
MNNKNKYEKENFTLKSQKYLINNSKYNHYRRVIYL